MHKGIEEGVVAGIKEYYAGFPVIGDAHINEVIKLEYLIPKVKDLLPEGEYELCLSNSDFIGYVDLITKNDDGTYDIYDFKYSNNVKNYMDSDQLHVYKHFFEQQTGKKARNLTFVFIPKVAIKQKKTEELFQFRNRIVQDLEKSEIKFVQVPFNFEKVIEFYSGIKKIFEATDFDKEPSYLCNWCEYQAYCERGETYMILPKNERRTVGKTIKKVIWLYGAPFSGKTFLANKFPDPLMLNTDGNVRFVDSPFIAIKDEVSTEGRLTKRVLAWQIFKDAVDELEKKQNDFKTIVVDLLEDCYEHCRLYMYDKLGITHESDDSFRAWDKVRIEYLTTIKKLINLDYDNIILISHEDSSKDMTKKSGEKITSIKPNMNDKTANKMAGMVDMVARVIADGDDRTLSFKTSEVIFGGGRLNVTSNTIKLDYNELMKVYDSANAALATKQGTRTAAVSTTSDPVILAADQETDSSANKVQVAEPETTRTRKRRGTAAPTPTIEPVNEEVPVEAVLCANEVQEAELTPPPWNEDPTPVQEEPVVKTRKRRGATA